MSRKGAYYAEDDYDDGYYDDFDEEDEPVVAAQPKKVHLFTCTQRLRCVGEVRKTAHIYIVD